MSILFSKNTSESQCMTILKFCCVTFCLLVVSCSQPKTPEQSKTLVIGTEKAVTTLDPRLAIDTYSDRASELICGGLFRIADNLQPVPHLASRYEVSDDGKTYDVWLRPNIRFHDGTLLTAEDAIATYEWILDPSNKSFYRNAFAAIDTMEAVQPNRLRFRLKQPYNPFLTALKRGIVPKRFAKEPFQAIGAGPYKLAENRDKEGLVLESFEQYIDGPPKVKRIYLKPVLDDSVRLLELLKGSVDLVQNGIPPTLLHRAKEERNVTVETTPGLAYAYLGFNLNDPLVGKRAVREAIAYAVNREEIIQYKLKNLALPANTVLAPSHYLHAKDLPQITFDPAKAKTILDAAGYKDPDGDGPKSRFKLTYKSSTNPERVEIAQVIADNLKQIGIDVELKTLEFGVFFDDVKKGNFQMYSLEWSGITSEDIYHDIFHSQATPPNGANRGRYANKQVDALVIKGREIADLNERRKIYRDVQHILAKDFVYVSLWYRKNIFAYQNRLANYKGNAVANYYSIVESYLKETS